MGRRFYARIVLKTALAALFLPAVRCGQNHEAQADDARSEPAQHASALLAGFNLSGLTVEPGEILPGGPPKDGIPALVKPAVTQASKASFLHDDDRVVTVTVGQQTRAYPIRILNWHAIINDDLAVAVLEHAREGFLGFVEESLEGTTPGRRLERFFQAALHTHRDRGFVGGCLWGNTALEMANQRLDPRYLSVVRDVFKRWKGLLAQTISAAQETGEVGSTLRAEVLATHVIASIEGGIMLSRLEKQAGPLAACLDALRQTLRLNPEPARRRRAKGAER